MSKYLLLIFLADGLLFLRSSYGKLVSGKFPEDLGGTLTKFAANNPHSWYKNLLVTQAIPQSHTIGILVMYGEALGALLITVGALGMLLDHQHRWFRLFLLKGLLITFVLNVMFWLASGWTSPASDSLNLFMAAVEFIGILAVLNLSRR